MPGPHIPCGLLTVTPRISSESVALKLPVASLQLVITALKCHKDDKNIQVTGSAALFYLTNSEYRMEQSVKLRRQVIQVVLNGMESYQEVTVRAAQAPLVPIVLFPCINSLAWCQHLGFLCLQGVKQGRGVTAQVCSWPPLSNGD